MGVKVAAACLHWSQASVPHSPSSSQTLASTVSFPSLRRRSFSDGALAFRYIQRLERSALFGTKLYRSRSCDHPKPRGRTIRRACSASLDAFSDKEFSKKIQELAARFKFSDDDKENTDNTNESEMVADSVDMHGENSQDSSKFNSSVNFVENQRPFDPVEPPDWPARDEIIPASIEWKANSVDLPLSLRIIKRKKQWQEGFREAGESAYCSVKKAFSSMVFIIRELHSFTLQMRETLLYEDLQGILVRVQKEMNASFVWLFQQVFSHTPTLMVYVMILLANYSVYSMASNAATAPPLPPQSYAATTESVSVFEDPSHKQQKFDSAAIKTFSVSSSSGKTTSIGGNNGGGGGKFRPVASSTGDGDGRFDGSASLNHQPTIIPDGVSSVGNPTRTREEESVSRESAREEESRLWNSIVNEATRMQAAAEPDDVREKPNGVFVEVIGTRSHEEELTLHGILRRLLADIFFPDPDSRYGSTRVVHRIKGSISENVPLLREASRNTGRDVLGWTRRGGPLRALLVVSVGTIALVSLTGLFVFMLFFLAATVNAIVISLLVSLAAAGGFLALFFACVTAIYIGALSVAVFVISTATISAIIAVMIATGWIGFFWIVWLAAKKSVGLVKHSVTMTGSALSAYSSARHARRHREPDEVSD